MTKADLVELVYEKIGGLSKKESQDIVETIFETMKASLKQGDKIKISGFGNFTLRDKRPRKGRNPQTGDDIEITARRVQAPGGGDAAGDQASPLRRTVHHRGRPGQVEGAGERATEATEARPCRKSLPGDVAAGGKRDPENVRGGSRKPR